MSVILKDLICRKPLLSLASLLFFATSAAIVVMIMRKAPHSSWKAALTAIPLANSQMDSLSAVNNELRTIPSDTEVVLLKEHHSTKSKISLDEALDATRRHQTPELIQIGLNYNERIQLFEKPTDPSFENLKEIVWDWKNLNFLERTLGPPVNLQQNYYHPAVINLKSPLARFRYRNRGEYYTVQSEGILIPLMMPVKHFKDLETDFEVNEYSTVIGVDTVTGQVVTGIFRDFSNTPQVFLSLTTRNFVVTIPFDNSGDVLGKRPANDNGTIYGWYSPIIHALSEEKACPKLDGQILEGTLPLLFKGEDGPNKLGRCMGGALLMESFDKEMLILVIGTCNQIANIFHSFKGNAPYVTIYNLDNGTYNLGLRPRDRKLTPENLKKYDLQNSNGGHGLYLIGFGEG